MKVMHPNIKPTNIQFVNRRIYQKFPDGTLNRRINLKQFKHYRRVKTFSSLENDQPIDGKHNPTIEILIELFFWFFKY